MASDICQSPQGELSVSSKAAFTPRECSADEPLLQSLEGRWKTMLSSQCTFDSETFREVMLNLIKNPNIMSSHLFRADVFYDSISDVSAASILDGHRSSAFTKHMKKDYQPLDMEVPGFEWQRSFVRRLVPRNEQLDKDLVQTCHFYTQEEPQSTRFLVLYLPHLTKPDDMPWYHPRVEQVAFLHEWAKDSEQEAESHSGSVSIHFNLFPDTFLDQRLERTALQLLSKIHKHGQGRKAGYQKRVHHDLIVPQQQFQNTYARLKSMYARALIGDWVEQTDPGKHVFEDLGIAAFLIELWADMYSDEALFPGFVDIGCGNGVLVNILSQEGYKGWGFDARRRKTWATFSEEVQGKVKEMVLVPNLLQQTGSIPIEVSAVAHERAFHDGMFEPGTFIVSNHADELTAWTPLLAHLNASPFIAIPCCSHNLAGARFRATPSPRAAAGPTSQNGERPPAASEASNTTGGSSSGQAAETGSLKRPTGAKLVPSAYASLCDYVTRLAEEVGFAAEKEMLRIPSTRNACIVGRRRRDLGPEPEHGESDVVARPEPRSRHSEDGDGDSPRETVCKILQRELDMSLSVVAEDWIKRAESIAGKKGDGH